MIITRASNEWASRPADQRFASLPELHAAVSRYKAEAIEVVRPYKDLSVNVDSSNRLALATNKGSAGLSYWAFGQLSRAVGAPASYLRELPATLAAQNLNYGIQHVVRAEPDKTAQVLINRNGDLRVRALTLDYTRIWNADITQRLMTLSDRGPWQPAPAAFDGSRGLYASDQDMFVFMVDSSRRIFEKRVDGGLSRGFFAWNSEVGAASFGIMTFLYEYVCGNHIVWGASGVKEVRIRHRGNDVGDRAFGELRATLIEYAESSEADDVARIERAMSYSLGRDKDEVLDKVFGLRIPALTRGRIDEAYQIAEQAPEAGNPSSAWGLAQGLTRLSQKLPYADERVAVDRGAGEVLELAF